MFPEAVKIILFFLAKKRKKREKREERPSHPTSSRSRPQGGLLVGRVRLGLWRSSSGPEAMVLRGQVAENAAPGGLPRRPGLPRGVLAPGQERGGYSSPKI